MTKSNYGFFHDIKDDTSFLRGLVFIECPFIERIIGILGRIKWYSGETKRVHSSLTSSKEETYKK